MKFLKLCADLLTLPERLHLIFLLLASLVIAGLETIGVALVIPLLQLISDPSASENNVFLREFRAIVNPGTDDEFLLLFAIGLVGAFFFKNAATMALVWWRLQFIQRTRMRLSVSLLRAYLFAPYVSHINRTVPELIRNMLTSVSVVFNGVVLGSVELIAEALVVAGIVALLFTQDFKSSLLIVAFLTPIVVSIFLVLRTYMSRLGRRTSDLNQEILHHTTQALSGAMEIKVLGREEVFVSHMARSGKALVNAQIANQFVSHMPRPLIETTVVAAMLLFIVTFVPAFGPSDPSTFSILGLYAAAAFRLTPSAGRIVQSANNVRFASRVIDDVYDDYMFFHRSQTNKEKLEGTINFGSALEIKDVSYSYKNVPYAALKNVNILIPKGQVLGIVGGSGAGKSTLVGVLLGLIEASEGQVLADGKDIWSGIRQWRSNIGYVPQNFYILSENIRRNVAFGLREKDIDKGRVRDALVMAQLWDFVQELPDGLETQLGENGIRLSGGQRQRIGIARALYSNPEILIFDEATSALDNETEKQISRTIHDLAGKKTIVIIAHRLSTVRECNELVFMKNGMVTGYGSFSVLFEKNPDFRRMVLSAETKGVIDDYKSQES